MDQIIEDGDTDEDDSVVGDLPSENYNYIDSESESTVSNSFEEPIIRSALILDQLREPDLDILDPVTDDHYREIRRSPSISPRPSETCSYVDKPNIKIIVS